MAGLGQREVTLQGSKGPITVKRNRYGIPCIKAEIFEDMLFALGWVHACDRLMAMELTRLIARGSAAEFLDPGLLNVDIVMRRYNLWGDSLSQAKLLSDETRGLMEAYCAGINHRLTTFSLPFEFKLIGYRPEPWTPADCIVMTKIIGIIDLSETQGWMEKFIIQMLQRGITLSQVKEMFPYITEEPDESYMEIVRKVKLPMPMVPETIPWAAIPRLQCSNNWVVSGKKSASGLPILCGDPHLDTCRLPAIWQEVVMQSGDFYFMGATVPGIPAPALGRTRDIAWSPTYGNMDVIDYFIEEVKDGRYRRGERWLPFMVREETLGVKKGKPVTVRFYENEHGVLEGEPLDDGYYLSFAWSGGRDCGAESAENMLKAFRSSNVKEAMACFAELDFAAFNWVVADREGNIGHKMSGRNPVRPEGCSGLLPLPGWDESYDWRGYHDRSKNPERYNPTEQFIATANEDMNMYAAANVNNLSMPPYRAQRIAELLEGRDKHTVESMKSMHYDLYSKQAEVFMPLIRPHLPENEKGKMLREWDHHYNADSLAAAMFENIYRELVKIVFGELNFGMEVWDYIIAETILFHDYFWSFDRILLRGESAWFKGKAQHEIFAEAVKKGLDNKLEPYGAGRKVLMKNLFFGGRLPSVFGFDYGPMEMPGGKATVAAGNIFKTAGRHASFSPTYRFITQFGEDAVHSVLAGGPSDRRFSRWYTSGVKDWLSGNYQLLKPE